MLTSGWLDVLGRDLKFTRRVLTKNVAFTTTAIVTLALGIAASTVIYSVVDAVLLRPLDYADSGDIYRVYTVDTVGLPRGTTGPPHIGPMAEEGQAIQAAFFGFSNEQSVVNDQGTAFAVSEKSPAGPGASPSTRMPRQFPCARLKVTVPPSAFRRQMPNRL